MTSGTSRWNSSSTSRMSAAEDGATRFVSWQKTKGIPVERHTLNYVDYPELYADASTAAAPAGSVVAYRPDVYHRSVDFTDTSRYRACSMSRSVTAKQVGRLSGLALPRLLSRAHEVRPAGHAAPARAHGRATARPPLLERGDAGRGPGALSRSRHDPLEVGAALKISRCAEGRRARPAATASHAPPPAPGRGAAAHDGARPTPGGRPATRRPGPPGCSPRGCR